MKHASLFIIFLIIVSLGCGGQPSTQLTTPPNADHLVEFNETGVAVLRGSPVSGGHSFITTKSTMGIGVAVEVDGIQTFITIPFDVRSETEISSSLVSKTTVREYLSSHSEATPLDAFPTGSHVEVTFMKSGTEFKAISIHEVEEEFTLFRKQTVVENVFTKDEISQLDVITGAIDQSSRTLEGEVSWVVAVPVDMHGVEAAVILHVFADADTQVNTLDGPVAYRDFSFGNVRILLTRNGDNLIAHQITELE